MPPEIFLSKVLKWCILTESGANFQCLGLFININQYKNTHKYTFCRRRWDKTVPRIRALGKALQYITTSVF